jgi:serine/threonine protein kinase
MTPDEQQHAVLCCRRFPQLTCSEALGTLQHDMSDESTSEAAHTPLFDLLRVLGVGSTSVVYLAKRLQPNSTPQSSPKIMHKRHEEAPFVAVKVINLEGRDDAERRRCFSELECLSMCSCFSVLRDHLDFRYPPDVTDLRKVQSLVLVLDFASSGDLRREIKRRRALQEFFSEHQVALILLQLVLGLKYIHEHRILHRDIKSSNVLLCSNGLVKLGDFGLSCIFPDDVTDTQGDLQASLTCVVSDEFCGTPFYVAPELWLRAPYSFPSDMYSLGVVLFEMMALRRPYEHSNLETLRDAVLTGSVPRRDWDAMERRYPSLVHIVRGLLSVEPKRRMTVDDILKLPSMRWSVSTLLQIAHSQDTVEALASADRDRIVRGVRRLSYSAASSCRHNASGATSSGRASSTTSHSSRVGTPFSTTSSWTSSPAKGTCSFVGAGSPARSFASGPRPLSFVLPSAALLESPTIWVDDDEGCNNNCVKRVVIMDGYVWRDQPGCEAKKRYLSLCLLTSSPLEELSEVDQEGTVKDPLDESIMRHTYYVCIAHTAGDQRVARRPISEFEDIFRAPPSALSPAKLSDEAATPQECPVVTARFGFVLMLRDGKRLLFRCKDEADCDRWVAQLEQALITSMAQ